MSFIVKGHNLAAVAVTHRGLLLKAPVDLLLLLLQLVAELLLGPLLLFLQEAQLPQLLAPEDGSEKKKNGQICQT